VNKIDYIRPSHMISTVWYDCNTSNHFKNCTILLYFIESSFYYLILYYCNTVCKMDCIL